MAKKPKESKLIKESRQLSDIQLEYNKAIAAINAQYGRINEINPYGSSSYSGTPETGFTRTETLSPEQQKIFNSQQSADAQRMGLFGNLVNQAASSLNNPLSYAGIANAPGSQDFSKDRQRVEQDLMDRYKRYADPQNAQERDALEQSIANRGIPLGSALHQQLMNEYEQRKNNSQLDAISQAIQSGGAEQSRLYGISATDRQNAIAERERLRASPMLEAQAVYGQGSGLQPQQWSQPGQVTVNSPDFSGTYGQLKGIQGQLDAAAMAANAQLEATRLNNQGGLDQLSLANTYAQQNAPKSGKGGGWASLGGSVAQGAGLAAGASLFR